MYHPVTMKKKVLVITINIYYTSASIDKTKYFYYNRNTKKVISLRARPQIQISWLEFTFVTISHILNLISFVILMCYYYIINYLIGMKWSIKNGIGDHTGGRWYFN